MAPNYLEKTIAVYNEDKIVINRVSSSKGMMNVHFTRTGDDVGHYDLLVNQEYSRGIEPDSPTRQTVSLKIIYPVPQRKNSGKRSNDTSVEITASEEGYLKSSLCY